MLPRQLKAKSFLWLLVLVPVIHLMRDVYAARTARSLAHQSFDRSHEHPVEALIVNGNMSFQELRQTQSHSYKTACDEYRRRYKAEPPPGFEAWYEFAVSNNSPIIDDFDSIYDSISPFWSIDGAEVSKQMAQAFGMANSEVWLCNLSGVSAKFDCEHPFRTHDRHLAATFNKLLGGLQGKLPDVKFLVNHFDEPAVLVPPPGSRSSNKVDLTYLSRSSTWNTLTKYCKSSRINGQDAGTPRTYGLSFVTNIDAAMDICKHPDYSTMHGLLMSPTSFRLIEGLVPVMSTGSLSTMGDILFPSPAYTDDEFRYDSAGDMEWEDKRNNLYWAGSTTGGYVGDENTWSQFHRQRFVAVAQNLDDRENLYLRASEKGSGTIRRVASRFLDRRLFDVAFTQIFSCTWRQCRDQRRHLDVRPWADRDAPLRSRLAFDLDGNGISGRFYRLLASQSAPFKQTLLHEWHDERLIPWVHYIPVSQGLGELPELVTYLTSTETGQRRAREIADAGRDWFQKAFREVDLAIYMYRLLLELARLQDPARKPMPQATR